MNKLVIFDLDGTLVDSIYDITDSINAMLKKFNYGKISYCEIKGFIGYGAKNLVKNCIEFCGAKVTDSELDERLEYYNNYYTNSNSPKTKVFDGLKETLIELKKRGYMLAIVTNKPHETLESVNSVYLKDIGFTKIVGSKINLPRKPNPTVTLSLINDINADIEKTYFVGDGETDIETAINAKVKGIAVLWGYRTKEQLEKAGAKRFANVPSDLLKIISC